MNFFNSVVNKISHQLYAPIEIIEVSKNLYHIPYPNSPAELEQIIQQLPSKPVHVQLWNLSQYPYNAEFLSQLTRISNADVVHATFQYYSCIPLTTAVKGIRKIKRYLSASKKNVVLVHCQTNKGRSSVFLGMYMYLTGAINDIATAMTYINERLKIKSKEQTLYLSQHTILKQVAIYYQDKNCLNKNHYRLTKIIINHAPKIPELKEDLDGSLKTLLQIRKGDEVMGKMVAEQYGQGEAIHFHLNKKQIILHDDCLLSLKYIQGNKLYPVIRVQINTNFIFNNFTRLQMQEIDIVSSAKSKYVFVDLIFQTIQNTQSELWKMDHEKKEAEVDNFIKGFPQKKEQLIDLKEKTTEVQEVQKNEVQIKDVQNGEENGEKKRQISEEDQKKEEGKQVKEENFLYDEFQIGGDNEGLASEEAINRRLQELQLKKQIKEAQENEEQSNDEQTSKQKEQPVKVESNEGLQKQQQRQEKENEAESDESDEDMDDYLAKLENKA